jgi:predicted membrane channel-forming protein YqfA (hemolysin III family)
MSRWLVTALPGWVLLLGLILLIAGGAVLIQTYVRRRYPALTRDEHNEATKFTYGFIGFVYAFFIGFMVSSMWGQINAADTNARSEGAAAVQMATDSAIFAAADTDRIHQSLLNYAQAAVAEWSHADQARSRDADDAMAEVYRAYEQVRAETDTQKTFLATSLSSLDNVSQARTVRLLTAQSDTGPPWPLWAVIFLTSAMVLGTVIIYGVEKSVVHYPMVAVVGVIVAANLFLVLELSHPFVGEIATSSDPLREVVSMLSHD